ncbi:hypothetical protein IJG44_07885 [bacterium]|nr:hypothetical protein [bacterium]
MKKIFAVCVILSISLLVAGCGGPKKETVSDSDIMTDGDIETADPENDASEDNDIVPDEEEKSDEESVEDIDEETNDEDEEEDEIDDFSLTQDCFEKKLLVQETVSVNKDDYNYNEYSYEYYVDRWYDENCRVKFESKYFIDPNGKVNRQQGRSYKYDDKGNVVKICRRNAEGEIINGQCRKFSYEFNGDGTIKKMCEGKSAEGKESGCVSYLYDKNGRIKQRIIRSAVTEMFPFFRDFSDEDAEYLSEDYAAVESVYINGNHVSEGIDMQERVDYLYDEKGKLTEKKRYFISKEFDEAGRDSSVYTYGGVPDTIASIDMTAKERITYDYSDGLLLKSRHDFYEYYMVCSGASWAWRKREHEKEYFYDEKMRPVRIMTSPDERYSVTIDDEWEYYPDGSLKRKVETIDDNSSTNDCYYYRPKALERIYDKKGRETGYNKIDYSGVYETTTRTYYDNSSEVKQETVCDDEENCKSYSYTYEHDGLGRVTEERKDYADPVDGGIDFETWQAIWLKQKDVTYYKYTGTGKLKESRAYKIQRKYEDETAPETVSKKRIEIYIYDEKDRLIEIRSASSWDEENPDIGSMSVQYTEYDSLDRVISDNGHVYEYRGDSDIRKKTWFKWGSTFYKYDENGNLVSEKYNKGAQRYNMEIEYDEDGYPVSAGKEYPNDEYERKETRAYSYETFQLP